MGKCECDARDEGATTYHGGNPDGCPREAPDHMNGYPSGVISSPALCMVCLFGCAARKAHRCDWCYGDIQPGEKYHRSTNIYDDRVYDWVSCAGCQALAAEVWDWAGWPDGGIGEDSFEEWAHDHREADERARGYLARRRCTCERCAP